mmetsp:Transcript_1246/g.2670  ORF Transcript_1246/g.2670 Transcript_1246/m.2670 type:complete len:334 (-) Transcript_1246:453-1454(-)
MWRPQGACRPGAAPRGDPEPERMDPSLEARRAAPEGRGRGRPKGHPDRVQARVGLLGHDQGPERGRRRHPRPRGRERGGRVLQQPPGRAQMERRLPLPRRRQHLRDPSQRPRGALHRPAGAHGHDLWAAERARRRVRRRGRPLVRGRHGEEREDLRRALQRHPGPGDRPGDQGLRPVWGLDPHGQGQVARGGGRPVRPPALHPFSGELHAAHRPQNQGLEDLRGVRKPRGPQVQRRGVQPARRARLVRALRRPFGADGGPRVRDLGRAVPGGAARGPRAGQVERRRHGPQRVDLLHPVQRPAGPAHRHPGAEGVGARRRVPRVRKVVRRGARQ